MRPRRTRRARLLAIGAGTAVAFVARKRMLTWGATDDELDLDLPGDALLTRPDVVATRAITIRATPGEIWPWLAQLGQGRGGFYTYDFLENLVGADIHSADTIVPEWQHIDVGDEVKLAPEVGLVVAQVEPNRSLVLHGGVQMGKVSPPYDFTWAFVLLERADGSTRLVVRERYTYLRGWAPLIVEPTGVISFVMTERMLREIRNRAERRVRANSAAAVLPSA
jgi:hypothetical protein